MSAESIPGVVAHAIQLAVTPVFLLTGLAGLLGGSVVVEVIFAVPGMGRLMFDGVVNKDMPVLQAGFVAIVSLSVLINTLADIAYALLDPRVRL